MDRHVAMEPADRLLTPREVALIFRVDPKTVTRWAAAGLIGCIRTPGGHRRFRQAEVTRFLHDRAAQESPHATAAATATATG